MFPVQVQDHHIRTVLYTNDNEEGCFLRLWEIYVADEMTETLSNPLENNTFRKGVIRSVQLQNRRSGTMNSRTVRESAMANTKNVVVFAPIDSQSPGFRMSSSRTGSLMTIGIVSWRVINRNWFATRCTVTCAYCGKRLVEQGAVRCCICPRRCYIIVEANDKEIHFVSPLHPK